MVQVNCKNCSSELSVFPSVIKKAIRGVFCSRSCSVSHRNKIDNPSHKRDLSGSNNPMWGKSYPAWNKGLKGEESHNWKGGIHERNDGYVRIRIDGKRQLLHRYLLKDFLVEGNVVHHKDGNPSNNDIVNLEVISNQKEHASLHYDITPITK